MVGVRKNHNLARMVAAKERADKAFEYYLALGESRTLVKVAKGLKIKHATLEDWSAKYKWPVTLEERLLEIQRESTRKSVDNISDQRAQYAIGLHNLVKLFFDEAQEGQVKIKSFGDLHVVLQNLRLELGEPTSRNKNENTSKTDLMDGDIDLFELAKDMGPEARKVIYDLVARLNDRKEAQKNLGKESDVLGNEPPKNRW